jgi:hypothetical protein
LSDIDGVLKRIPLALMGRFVKGGQKFSITRETLAQIVRNFRKRLAPTVIDYEHASEHPEDAAGGPVPAAGWIKTVDDAPDSNGVLWGQAEFTPRAQRMIADKEYQYFSPCINWGARDKHTGEPQGATLNSAALTNRPFLEGLPAIAMSDAGWRREVTNVSLPNFNPVPSHLQQDWSQAQREINGRVGQMLTANRLLNWNEAYQAVMVADPGLAPRAWDEVNVELNRRVKQIQDQNNYDPSTGAISAKPAGRPLDYRRALTAVMNNDAGFARYYADAKAAWLGRQSQPDAVNQVDAEIAPLVREKLAASDGRMGYRDAFMSALSERPDLARRRNAAMRNP